MKTEYVLGFLFTEARDAVVLIEKKRPEWQAGKLNGVGGKIEQNESPADAMAREFREETGVSIPSEEWQYFLTIEGSDWRVFIYRSFVPGQGPILKAPTDEKPEWCMLNTGNQTFAHKVIPNLLWIIPLALDSDRLCGAITYLSI